MQCVFKEIYIYIYNLRSNPKLVLIEHMWDCVRYIVAYIDDPYTQPNYTSDRKELFDSFVSTFHLSTV